MKINSTTGVLEKFANTVVWMSKVQESCFKSKMNKKGLVGVCEGEHNKNFLEGSVVYDCNIIILSLKIVQCN